MACRKCGSDWVTPTGKDCSRCPSCDKQQLFQARKQGRLPAVLEKTCRICGNTFTVKPTSQHATTCRSEECRAVRAKEKALRHKERKALGLAGTQAPRQQRKQCKRDGCHAAVKDNRHDYCSPTCAGADAREYKRDFMGLPAEVRLTNAFADWMYGWDTKRPKPRKARPRKPRPPCQTCGTEVNEGASRFCSDACMSAWRGNRPCVCCSVMVSGCRSQGKVYCDQCKANARREYRKKYKRELGSHRKKVRKGGGFWNPDVRRSVVLSRDRYRCYLCHTKCRKTFDYNDPRSATVDMIVPASRGGDWEYHNLRCACRKCNSLKSNKLVGQLTLRMAT